MQLIGSVRTRTGEIKNVYSDVVYRLINIENTWYLYDQSIDLRDFYISE